MTFLIMDLNDVWEMEGKIGSMEGNGVRADLARMMKKVFRGGDLIFRQGGDEFLTVMPDTSEQQAENPLHRLLTSVEQWNAENGKVFQLSFTWGMAGYVTGTSLEDVMRTVDRKLYQKMHNLAPVF